jgi:hypothetical protein
MRIEFDELYRKGHTDESLEEAIGKWQIRFDIPNYCCIYGHGRLVYERRSRTLVCVDPECDFHMHTIDDFAIRREKI